MRLRPLLEGDPFPEDALPLPRPMPSRAAIMTRPSGLSRGEDANMLDDCPPLLMATSAWFSMMNDLTSRPVEAGGMLIGPSGHDSVTHYVPDLTGSATTASFTFDHVGNNEVLRQFVKLGLDAKGVAHSHPFGCLTPSGGDLEFVRNCFGCASVDCDRFYLPIVVGKRLFPYIVLRRDPLVVLYAQLILF